MSRNPAASERTPTLHDQQTYEQATQHEHEYLDSDLVQGVLSQIVNENSDVSNDLVTELVELLDQSDGSLTEEEILMQFPDRRGPADRTLSQFAYYCLTLEAEHEGETIIGLHPNGKQAARRGYETDRTRRAVLD